MLNSRASLVSFVVASLAWTAGCGGGEDFAVEQKPGTDGGGGTSADASVDAVEDGAAGGTGGTSSGGTGGTGGSAAEGGSDATADAISCESGTADCDDDPGCETTTDTDPDHCGECENACPGGGHATATCVGGQCGLACETDYDDCDDNAGNGCEADLGSTATCGSCGQRCGDQHAAATCNDGVCELTCVTGFEDCNGVVSDGCEAELATDGENCGWCGHACGGATCDAGLCEPLALATGQAGAVGLAVDDTHLYFTAYEAKRVGRVPKTGGLVETLMEGAGRGQVLLDGTYVYLAGGVEFSTGLYRFSKTGPFTETALTTGITGNQFVLDSSVVYYTDATHATIWMVPKVGGVPSSLATGQTFCLALAATPTNILWSMRDAEEIRTMPKGGGAVSTLVAGAGKTFSLATDDAHLYWTTPTEVRRADLNGSNASVLTTQPEKLTFLALDAGWVYFLDSTGLVRAVRKDGSEVRAYASGFDTAFGIAVDDAAIYVAEAFGTQGGAVWRIPK